MWTALLAASRIIQRLGGHWLQLIDRATLMIPLFTGAVFRDGVLIEHPARTKAVPPAA